MEKLKISWILDEIADLLQLLGENPYKVRSYRKAAQIIGSGEYPLNGDNLESIPGVGKKIAREILAIKKESKSPLREHLIREVPSIILEVKEIPGINLETAAQIYKKGKIYSKEDLLRSLRARKLRKIPGIGAKLEKNIRDFMTRAPEGGPFLLPVLQAEANSLRGRLEFLPGLKNLEVAGGIRRKEKVANELVLVISSQNPALIRDNITLVPRIKDYKDEEGSNLTFKTPADIPVRVVLVAPENFVPVLIKETGPLEHWKFLQQKSREKGLKLEEQGLFNSRGVVNLKTEEGLYSKLGLSYPIPEVRHRVIEDGKNYPGDKIVSLKDIRGDLHLHTTWSDGGATIEEMGAKARERGYGYLAITDHSPALRFAGGMSLVELREQMDYIDHLNAKSGMKFILKGIEADINRDGSLDIPEDYLKELDWVVASVHREMKLPREEMTKRLVKAASHPRVKVIGHPTARLYPQREGIELDFRELCKAAAASGTALEINGGPDRRDIDEYLVETALGEGVKMCLGSDAHNEEQLDYMNYALAEAQRAGLEPKDILNTKTLKDLME